MAGSSLKGSRGEHLSLTNPKSALTVSSYQISSSSDIVVIPKISSLVLYLIIINRIIVELKRDNIAIVYYIYFIKYRS